MTLSALLGNDDEEAHKLIVRPLAMDVLMGRENELPTGEA
jgi:hypothetical protein